MRYITSPLEKNGASVNSNIALFAADSSIDLQQPTATNEREDQCAYSHEKQERRSVNDMKVVIVTGAGSGIGAATAKRFVNDGFNVVLNGRNERKLQDVADAIGSENALIVQGDVSSEADVDNLITQTRSLTFLLERPSRVSTTNGTYP
ncbi:3-oxoacyl-ACP reductase-like protein [Rhodopirellula rubra]|uniref:3-oxoacyl-ACP reductase-like protein n=1 Tax=Aporhodopirellula rubra TaxID=980271 RepID=A0A7W5DYZ6_9BACT|nr:SDR family NAD(P)-dependent oxidoreductase [Aporhodopirellula rubra]MBB3206772.1 3-oxoacyl-ACP reductase-like protein [Aporhodopirellula rubra]